MMTKIMAVIIKRSEAVFWIIILALALAANIYRSFSKLDVPTLYVVGSFAILGVLLWRLFVKRKSITDLESFRN